MVEIFPIKLGHHQVSYMHLSQNILRGFCRFLWLFLTLVFSVYSGGVTALLWSGLPVSRVNCLTFLSFNMEFHHEPAYNTLLTVSWIAFFIPILIFFLIISRSY